MKTAVYQSRFPLSRTFQCQPQASKQAPIGEILQAYQNQSQIKKCQTSTQEVFQCKLPDSLKLRNTSNLHLATILSDFHQYHSLKEPLWWGKEKYQKQKKDLLWKMWKESSLFVLKNQKIYEKDQGSFEGRVAGRYPEDMEIIHQLKCDILKELVAAENSKTDSSDEDKPLSTLKDILRFSLDAIPYGLAGHFKSAENFNYLFSLLFPLRKMDREEEAKQKKFIGDPTHFDEKFTYFNNVIERIIEGATFLSKSLIHWRTAIENDQIGYILPNPDKNKVEITTIRLAKSDLHDVGLGAAFVTFKVGGTDTEVVVKPENRDIEESLFSSESEDPEKKSLARKLNEEYTWRINGRIQSADAGKIQTLRMKATREFGTIIEKCVGEEIDKVPANSINEISTIKSIVFASLSGLYDLHHENVIWKDGLPYFIDADNALKDDVLLNTSHAQKQSGFPAKFRESQTTVRISFLCDGIFEDIQQAFNGKHGRVVPLATQRLAEWRNYYWDCKPDDKKSFQTYYIDKLKNGILPSPGLKKETGKDSAVLDDAKHQMDKDFMHGQLPFYEYWYTDGHIKHNGSIIYQGKTLNEALAEMKERPLPR